MYAILQSNFIISMNFSVVFSKKRFIGFEETKMNNQIKGRKEMIHIIACTILENLQ